MTAETLTFPLQLRPFGDFFGKSLHELVREGLSNKLLRMPADAQEKVQETLSKIINEGNGGMICILL